MVADVFAGKVGEDVGTYDRRSWQVHCNDVLLAIGKFADLATDWVLVAQMHKGVFGPRPVLVWVAVACASTTPEWGSCAAHRSARAVSPRCSP